MADIPPKMALNEKYFQNLQQNCTIDKYAIEDRVCNFREGRAVPGGVGRPTIYVTKHEFLYWQRNEKTKFVYSTSVVLIRIKYIIFYRNTIIYPITILHLTIFDCRAGLKYYLLIKFSCGVHDGKCPIISKLIHPKHSIAIPALIKYHCSFIIFYIVQA